MQCGCVKDSSLATRTSPSRLCWAMKTPPHPLPSCVSFRSYSWSTTWKCALHQVSKYTSGENTLWSFNFILSANYLKRFNSSPASRQKVLVYHSILLHIHYYEPFLFNKRWLCAMWRLWRTWVPTFDVQHALHSKWFKWAIHTLNHEISTMNISGSEGRKALKQSELSSHGFHGFNLWFQLLFHQFFFLKHSIKLEQKESKFNQYWWSIVASRLVHTAFKVIILLPHFVNNLVFLSSSQLYHNLWVWLICRI